MEHRMDEVKNLEEYLDIIDGYDPEYMNLPFKFDDYNWKCKKCHIVFDCIDYLNEHRQYFHNNNKAKKQSISKN